MVTVIFNLHESNTLIESQQRLVSAVTEFRSVRSPSFLLHPVASRLEQRQYVLVHGRRDRRVAPAGR